MYLPYTQRSQINSLFVIMCAIGQQTDCCLPPSMHKRSQKPTTPTSPSMKANSNAFSVRFFDMDLNVLWMISSMKPNCINAPCHECQRPQFLQTSPWYNIHLITPPARHNLCVSQPFSKSNPMSCTWGFPALRGFLHLGISRT